MSLTTILKLARAQAAHGYWCPVCECTIGNGSVAHGADCPLAADGDDTPNNRMSDAPPQGFRCATCKQWAPRSYVAADLGYGRCERGDSDNDCKPIDAETLAFALGDTYHPGEFLCKPDFGCTQWEAR